MHIVSCENCRYLDLMENMTGGCPRCRGRMVSLDVDSAAWNAMSMEEREAILDEKVPRQQDAQELFREWLALKPGHEEVAEEETVPDETDTEEVDPAETVTASEEDTLEEAVIEEPAPEEPAREDTVLEQKAAEDNSSVPEAEYPRISEYVYVCYKCNSIAGHDGENEGYYCPECGSAMVDTGLDTIEWANLSKEEKRNVMEEAKIRHMVTAIKEASYEDSESEKTQSIIKVVGNNPYLNPERK